VIQSNTYYAFGMQTSESWTRTDTQPNKYLYNAGSELNGSTGNYEMFFREYDPALGRMNAIDPMASKYASLTPYNYSFNDPVTFNDPSGADPYYDPNYYRGNGNHGNHGYYYTDMLYNDGGFYHKYGREVTPYSFQSSLASILGNRTYSQLSGATSANMWAYSLYQAEQRQMNKSQVTANKDGITLTGSAAANFVSFIRLGGGITISFTEGAGKKGRDLVSITLLGLVINNSSKDFSEKQLDAIAMGIELQIEKSFKGRSKGIEWSTNATIGTVADAVGCDADPFQFILVDDVRALFPGLKYGSVGYAKPYGNKAYLNATGHDYSRTGAHEFGHSLALWHMEDGRAPAGRNEVMTTDHYPGNLMHQYGTENSLGVRVDGTTIEAWQIWEILIRIKAIPWRVNPMK
jgi:RHS repeat-associated protein